MSINMIWSELQAVNACNQASPSVPCQWTCFSLLTLPELNHWCQSVLQWTVAFKDLDLNAKPGTAVVSEPFEASGYHWWVSNARETSLHIVHDLVTTDMRYLARLQIRLIWKRATPPVPHGTYYNFFLLSCNSCCVWNMERCSMHSHKSLSLKLPYSYKRQICKKIAAMIHEQISNAKLAESSIQSYCDRCRYCNDVHAQCPAWSIICEWVMHDVWKGWVIVIPCRMLKIYPNGDVGENKSFLSVSLSVPEDPSAVVNMGSTTLSLSILTSDAFNGPSFIPTG